MQVLAERWRVHYTTVRPYALRWAIAPRAGSVENRNHPDGGEIFTTPGSGVTGLAHGSGLGLAIARHAVLANGGKICMLETPNH